MSDERLARLTLTPGSVIAGKYCVERVLGEGGMGVVVAATHLELGERVAVKFLHPDATAIEEVAQRFVREARAAVKIKNEHVARVIDVGRTDSGSPYMVLEYLEGQDLGTLKHGERLPIEDAVDYVIQACDAMAEAHVSGIVHRDLKPANLFLTHRADGTPLVKVLDFGISKMAQPDSAGLALTRTAATVGSPLYMSPEQMRSAKTVDHRTDIWSLGTILFELLTGSTPFVAATLTELCAAVFTEAPRRVRELRPDVPEALEQVILKCLQRDPAARYQNVAELASALEPFAPRRSRPLVERIGRVLSRAGLVEEPTPPSSSGAAPGPAAPTVPFGEAARTNVAWTDVRQREPRRRSPLVAAGAFVAVAVLGTASWMLTRQPRSARPEPAAGSSSAPGPTTSVMPASEPRVVPSSTPVAPASASTGTDAPPTPSGPSRPTQKDAKSASKKSEPRAKPDSRPEPKPAPQPKNPLDISLK